MVFDWVKRWMFALRKHNTVLKHLITDTRIRLWPKASLQMTRKSSPTPAEMVVWLGSALLDRDTWLSELDSLNGADAGSGSGEHECILYFACSSSLNTSNSKLMTTDRYWPGALQRAWKPGSLHPSKFVECCVECLILGRVFRPCPSAINTMGRVGR